jgi:hypothetical protein
MKQKYVILIVALVLIGLGSVIFDSFFETPDKQDPALSGLIEQLHKDGFKVISIDTTVLGRYRIEAHSDGFEREIVLAPGTGTFLRDDITPLIEGDADGKK